MLEPEIPSAVLAGFRDVYRDVLAALTGAGGGHLYLSTGCLHGGDGHDYCAAMTGWQGKKRPSQCKFCSAACICACHSCPTCSGPVRETAGMICQTCGTDYASPASAGEPKAQSKAASDLGSVVKPVVPEEPRTDA